ncbi:MAG: hypothetical protein JFR41_07330 [Muribaculaceae bacterium]|nr:hypothetical protein [Muribaculaceae bacterium]
MTKLRKTHDTAKQKRRSSSPAHCCRYMCGKARFAGMQSLALAVLSFEKAKFWQNALLGWILYVYLRLMWREYGSLFQTRQSPCPPMSVMND